MKRILQRQPITTINCMLLFLFSCFLADFIPDGQLDIVQHLLEFIFNLCHHYNAVHLYLTSCHVKIILFYSLLFIKDYGDITLSFHLTVLLSLITLLFIKINFCNSNKITFLHQLVSYHKLKQDIIKAFESIP